MQSLSTKIGSGHGKFACLALQHLLDLEEFLPFLEEEGKEREKANPTTNKTEEEIVGAEESANGEESANRTLGSGHNSHASGGSPMPEEGEMGEGQGFGNGKGGVGVEARKSRLPFKYVVTDVAQGTLDFVRRHPSMQRFVEMGLLEVALLDAEDPNPLNDIHLQISGEVVFLDQLKNPVVAICNYVFDSLLQDAFRIKNGVLYENR
ncbi:unnamed protein product, partial [Choristocarpus tenellus]